MVNGNLLIIRNAMNMAQEDFAAICGIPRGTYVHYELGHTKPSLIFMQKLMDLTGFDLKTLLDKDLGEEPPEKISQIVAKSMAKIISKRG